MNRGRVLVGVCALMMTVGLEMPYAQGNAPTLTANAGAGGVSLSWTAVANAAAYEVQAGPAGTASFVTVTTVAGTSLGPLPVPPGAYQVRVRGVAGAIQGPFSNTAVVTVGAASLPTPTGFAATVNGNSVLLSWAMASTTGVSSVVLDVLSGPGGAVIQQFPLGVTTSFSAAVPNGTYTARVRTVGSGAGGASNEATFTVPSCSAAAAIPLSVTSFYGQANLSWPSVPGASGYTISALQNGAQVANVPLPASTTFLSSPINGGANYQVTLRANLGACGSAAGSASFTGSNDAPPGPRGAPGLGLGYTTGIVASVTNQMAAQFPGALARSCGNYEWLFRVVRALRQIDNRFGMNWKRGVVGDFSHDVVTYNFSTVPDNSATAPHMYAWDIISNHCGSNPVPNAANITNAAGQAAWTIRPYLQAGYTP